MLLPVATENGSFAWKCPFLGHRQVSQDHRHCHSVESTFLKAGVRGTWLPHSPPLKPV